MFHHFDCSVFSFRMALLLDPSDRYVIFNFGSALYQINSRMRRFGDKLAMDDLRRKYADCRIRGLLEESGRHFATCVLRLPDGDVDKWRCHYFLAKIAEKRNDKLENIFFHYHESARQLEAAGVQYPNRISLKKQEHAEAIEVNTSKFYFHSHILSLKRILLLDPGFIFVVYRTNVSGIL
ncbi:unnamed protein product [Gongylonema pulchrum]|uniref:TPR_REGION domain-containing protein n=1 Tax=Gongylonema pulchrum TaxID=637853 RepID=A0A183DC30_9BILA|nr:unnamed protein product [Gongylonema pulchrum]